MGRRRGNRCEMHNRVCHANISAVTTHKEATRAFPPAFCGNPRYRERLGTFILSQASAARRRRQWRNTMIAKFASSAPREALLLSAGLIVSASLIAGCAINPAPREELAAAHEAIDAAQVAGADDFAVRELRLARDKIALGERWIAASDNKPARWLVEQAQLDAELAALKAASARARRTAAASTLEFRAFNVLFAQGTNLKAQP
jgi:hypothetical protein